jgi:hypothetical protein
MVRSVCSDPEHMMKPRSLIPGSQGLVRPTVVRRHDIRHESGSVIYRTPIQAVSARDLDKGGVKH